MAHIRVDTQFVPSTTATIHTVTTGLVLTEIEYSFLNRDSSDRLVTVWHVPNGQSEADDYETIGLQATTALKPGENRVYIRFPKLQAGDFIRWKCDAASKVTGEAGGLEEAP